MDRRQRKTRAAIFKAFTTLILEKQYNKITIQEIIDEANVGRSTFYAHFETKEMLLQSFCKELFEHILESAAENGPIKGRYSNEEAPKSVFCHILQHLERNDHNILTLFTSDSSEIFKKYFKDCLKELITERIANPESVKTSGLPEEFIVNYVAGSFVEMVEWWSQNGKKQTPEELDRYYHSMLPKFLEYAQI